MTLEYFRRLGVGIEEAFRRAHYDENALVQIARDFLAADPAHESVEPLALLASLAAGDLALPQQFSKDLSFGQPPVTVFFAEHFVIDVYFWFDGTTATHQHAFSGAFQVLGGSSLHARRTFDCSHRVNSRFLVGTVQTEFCELLKVGDTREIHAGFAFAHALFHLDYPSSTVVVRTKQNRDALPQYLYHYPHVARDPITTQLQRVQSAALDGLNSIDRAAYYIAARAAISGATLEETFLRLDALDAQISNETNAVGYEDERFLEVRAEAEQRHGADLIGKLCASIAFLHRERELIAGRRFTKNAEERFLLAVLLNSHTRPQVLQFMTARYPERDPLDAFMDLFGQMARNEDGENALGLVLGEDAIRLTRFVAEGVAVDQLESRMRGGSTIASNRYSSEIRSFYEILRATPALKVLTIE